MPDQIKNINDTIGKLNEQATSFGLNSNIPTVNSSLGQSSLNPQPKFDLSVSTRPIDTPNVDNFQQEQRTNTEISQKQQDMLSKQLEKNQADTAAATQTSWDDYLNQVLNAPTFSEIQAQQYKAEGVDEKQLQADKLNTQLIAEQDALRTKFEKLDQNKIGAFGGAVEQMKAEAERASLAKQADIALLQLAAQDQLDYATRVADRAVNAMFERQEKIEKVRKEIYETNKDLFTKAEQRSFEVALADRERQLNSQKEAELSLRDSQVEALKMAQMNEAPQSVIDAIMASKSPLEVLDVAGAYGSSDLLDRQLKKAQLAEAKLQYEKLASELSGQGDELALTADQREAIAKMPESKQAQTLITLNDNLNRLRSLYETYGNWNPINREAAKKISALRSQLEIDIAVAGGQGAISEQEADRYKNVVGGKLFERGSKAAAAIDEAIRTNDTKISNNLKYVESALPGANLFEPFAAYQEQKKAIEYIQSQQGEAVPTTDDAALDQWLTAGSTPMN